MAEVIVPERRAPGGGYSLSAITISLATGVGAPPLGTPLAVPLLRKARALGVTVFDLSGTRSSALAEETIVRAFPQRDPELTVLLAPFGDDRGERRSPGSSDRGPPSPEPTPASIALERSLERLAGRYRVIVHGAGPADQPQTPPGAAPWLLDLRREGRILDVISPLRAGPDERLPRTAGLCSASLSLLAPRVAEMVRRNGAPEQFGLVARDVFAAGALDGSLLGGPLGARGPNAPPLTVAELHGHLDPVLRLGFLTRDRRRTLVQAALGFALQWPWVLTAEVPLPPPERLEAVLKGAASPGLSEAELVELGLSPAPDTPREASEGN